MLICSSEQISDNVSVTKLDRRAVELRRLRAVTMAKRSHFQSVMKTQVPELENTIIETTKRYLLLNAIKMHFMNCRTCCCKRIKSFQKKIRRDRKKKDRGYKVAMTIISLTPS